MLLSNFMSVKLYTFSTFGHAKSKRVSSFINNELNIVFLSIDKRLSAISTLLCSGYEKISTYYLPYLKIPNFKSLLRELILYSLI